MIGKSGSLKKKYRIVWWDWKDHVPVNELTHAAKDGLVWMRIVPDTHCDQYGVICSSDAISLEEAEEAWIVGWEQRA